MKKEHVGLMISATIGVIVVLIILFLNSYTKGENKIWNTLVQGEVLAGIVIAFPTLWTWSNAINEEKENKKNLVSDNIRDTVKYYDKQLFDLVSDISKGGQLSLNKANKIEYIVNTYNTLLSEWKENSGLNISLDFVQVLPVICSIKYPESIEEPGNEESENWKNNLEIALKPVLKEVVALNKQYVLGSKEIKYFSLITFSLDEYNIKNFEFVGKHFVQCTFSSDFIESNQFDGCTFINCSIQDGELPAVFQKNIKEPIIIGEFEGYREENLVSDNKLDSRREKTMEDKGNHCQMFDAREGIVVDDFIMGKKYFEITSVLEEKTEIYKEIVNKLKEKINLDDKINNKRISISKNYITDENGRDETFFTGWHSIFKERLENQNNFKYFIFCIKEKNTYYTIVFEKENFFKFLEKKNTDKTGKYNFYFTNQKTKKD
ncbi:TPA: hypothetical protein ACGOV2_000966 [Streptococcus suis]